MHPVEACAILFGKLSHDEAVIEKIKFAPNELKSTLEFKIDPAKAVAFLTEAEEEGLVFIGLFHSHPTPAVPSPIDLKYMKLWGDALWLILSSSGDNLAAYQLIDNRLKQATVIIE